MARLNDLATLVESYEDTICRLAEMAGIIRSARRHGFALPVLCLLDCDPHHWAAWGAAEICTNCGSPPLPADTWHTLLVASLRRLRDDNAHLAVQRCTVMSDIRAA